MEKKTEISILLKKDLTTVEITHKNGIHMQNGTNSFLKKEKTLYSIFKKSSLVPTYFFLPIAQFSSLEKAIERARQLLEITFKDSELSVYLQENQNIFSLQVGPFIKKTDIDFVKENLNPFFVCQEIK